MRIEEALERFLAQLESDGRSRHTIEQYRRHVGTLAQWAHEVGHSGDVSGITDEDLERFLRSAQARTSARGGEKRASSLACLRASLSAFLRHVRRSACLPGDRGVVIESRGPKSAIRVESYRELDQYAAAFGAGHLNLLILVGSPGLQKSRAIREAVGKSACWIEGHATPFGIYRKLWEGRNRPVVIDDVDDLYRSRDGLRLLKSLCQTEPVKSVAWHSEAAVLRREGIPREFRTTSRVAIIANDWTTLDQNVAAVEDRGIAIVFEPSPLEVHLRTATWFWDQEVFDFLGERLHLFPELSMRLYRQLWELKEAGIDWRSVALKRQLSGTAYLVAAIEADPSYSSEKERIEAFMARGGASPASYLEHAAVLRPKEPPARIVLRSVPPKEPKKVLLEETLGLLRGRTGPWENN